LFQEPIFSKLENQGSRNGQSKHTSPGCRKKQPTEKLQWAVIPGEANRKKAKGERKIKCLI